MSYFFFFSSRRRHTRCYRDWSSDVCSSDLFGLVGKPPDQVTSQEVFAWAYGRGLSGKEPSATTIAARIACLSSFFRFLIRMKAVIANPCEQLERPRPVQSAPRGLGAEEIRRLLSAIPDTPPGLRD